MMIGNRPSRLPASLLIPLFALAVSVSEGEARAQTAAEIPGTVLSIDEEDIVVDLGMSKGGTEGSVVELWRPFKLRHP